MKVYHLKRVQTLSISQQDAWDFFSSPANLALITPDYMKFRIIYTSGQDTMYAGQIIRYKVNIFPKIPVSWTTEITHVDEPYRFVDEQRSGPYSLWHHQHHFREVEGGLEMTDDIHYSLPLGFLGKLAHELFVKKQLNRIFDYRKKVLDSRFGRMNTLVSE
jgi:ligand-binding SRPBCC domain-containing protein